MDLPQTLHGQLYLLAYDRKRRRFDIYNHTLFGFALSAAILTDLYLTGFLEDKSGRPHRANTACPRDPLLRVALERVSASTEDWAELIAQEPKRVSRVVRDQLQTTGWLCVQRRPILGVVPARLTVYDDDMVGYLSIRVTEALRNAINGLGADPRPLAVGMLGVLGQMPTVLSFKESSRYRQDLREMTLAAIEPILGLHRAIQTHYEDLRRDSFGG
ncbi:MAG TPA: GPP34 family phosphoprotein [Mycobacterium sp.]